MAAAVPPTHSGSTSMSMILPVISGLSNRMVGAPSNVRGLTRRQPGGGGFGRLLGPGRASIRRPVFPSLPTPPGPDGSVGMPNTGMGGGPLTGGLGGLMERILSRPSGPNPNHPMFGGGPGRMGPNIGGGFMSRGPMRDPRGMWGGPPTSAPMPFGGGGRFEPGFNPGGGGMFPSAPMFPSNPMFGGGMYQPPMMGGGGMFPSTPPMFGGNMGGGFPFGGSMGGGGSSGIAALLANLFGGGQQGGFTPPSFAGWPGMDNLSAPVEQRPDPRGPMPDTGFNPGMIRAALPFNMNPGNVHHNAFGRMFGAI